MLKKISLLLIPVALTGCAINSTSVSLQKTPQYPHNYAQRVAQVIKPSLKELNTDTFYKVSDPQRLTYTITANLINSFNVDGYAVCYMVSANNENGVFDGNNLFMFIFDGETILHSVSQTKFNLIENSRLYKTCNQIQKAQNVKE